MDENTTTDGNTAMERLCRELMENVNSYSWCREHIPSVIEDIGDWEMWDYGKAIAAVRSDIERRIAEADLSDDKARDRALVDWRERIAELDALCRVLNAESADEAVAVARTMAEEHYELKKLREAGRVMPEGMSWPRYADGEQVRVGDEMRGTGRSQHVFRVVGVAPGNGRMTVVCEDMDEGGKLCYVDPDLLARERPDSWEKLREDAAKEKSKYWMCSGATCFKCPAKVDGKTPAERYGTDWCNDAMQLDLIARAERLAGVAR